MNESELLTRARAEEIFGLVQQAARAEGVADIEAMMGAGSSALTRFANNTIHQNVAERGAYISVRALIDGRTARANSNRFDPDSLRRVTQEAIAITRLQAPDPELLPLPGPQPAAGVDRLFGSTAAATPATRAGAVRDAIAIVESASLTAAGIYSTNESAFAILNSAGLFDYYCETMAQFSITAIGADSSGWAKESSCDVAALDTQALARRAAQKASASTHPAGLPAGRYTVILEPAAVLDMVGQMMGDFSATAVEDGRSFLAGRTGEKLFGENISIADDVYHPAQSGAPFDGEGVPRQRLPLVERGVIGKLTYSRQAARKAGTEPTGHGLPLPNEYGEAPANIVIAGGDSTVDQMIASTRRGLLVTRLWYIREVDPYQKIMTGMTRDGTFLIESGQIAGGVRNFRFNQSLVELLCNVEALSAPVRSSGEEAFDMVVPAMKVNEFHFTEVTKF
ncbi:MAG TPA: TldD/PmbA family protein [Candidatus Binataceae bacterium]|nr:TldD/PmbA family protein [Candidatus Binataceae bacterium]